MCRTTLTMISAVPSASPLRPVPTTATATPRHLQPCRVACEVRDGGPYRTCGSRAWPFSDAPPLPSSSPSNAVRNDYKEIPARRVPLRRYCRSSDNDDPILMSSGASAGSSRATGLATLLTGGADAGTGDAGAGDAGAGVLMMAALWVPWMLYVDTSSDADDGASDDTDAGAGAGANTNDGACDGTDAGAGADAETGIGTGSGAGEGVTTQPLAQRPEVGGGMLISSAATDSAANRVEEQGTCQKTLCPLLVRFARDVRFQEERMGGQCFNPTITHSWTTYFTFQRRSAIDRCCLYRTRQHGRHGGYSPEPHEGGDAMGHLDFLPLHPPLHDDVDDDDADNDAFDVPLHPPHHLCQGNDGTDALRSSTVGPLKSRVSINSETSEVRGLVYVHSA
ncbi:uncharacterized protein EI90DRAFT_3290929 [Cantharellus anzutake]|uniref:uncharacterized protein n=1 Tax=Cantharellus anzutake TaxID=1750568 RepID=UPI001908720E|nr:uncharacterized protein EI90DRAFT_3290929 [Cantharellus anzutake]KAF8327627.1 hypothetical protein EI90DRAFT_3290929 [Cantharellus anzutake]